MFYHFEKGRVLNVLSIIIILPRYIAMSDVSMEMIQSTAFHEMLPMQTTTVCALWSQLKQAIDSKWLVFSFYTTS